MAVKGLLDVTDEKRNAIDNQIRERILREQAKTDINKLPVTAMVYARVSLCLGINLQNACPYMRICNNKTPNLCIHHPYRECLYYKLSLTGDIIDGKIDIVEAGLDKLVI